MKSKIVVSLLIFGLQAQGLMSFDFPPCGEGKSTSGKVVIGKVVTGFSVGDRSKVARNVLLKKKDGWITQEDLLAARRPGQWAHITTWNERMKEYDRLNDQANSLEQEKIKLGQSREAKAQQLINFVPFFERAIRWLYNSDDSDHKFDREVKKIRLEAHKILTGNDYSRGGSLRKFNDEQFKASYSELIRLQERIAIKLEGGN